MYLYYSIIYNYTYPAIIAAGNANLMPIPIIAGQNPYIRVIHGF
jgi:hypothetical protein